MPSNPKRVAGEDMVLRELAGFTRRLARREAAVEAARADWLDMIRAALAAGVSTRKVAAAAGVAQPRVVQLAGGGR